jgi:hypothetical protein
MQELWKGISSCCLDRNGKYDIPKLLFSTNKFAIVKSNQCEHKLAVNNHHQETSMPVLSAIRSGRDSYVCEGKSMKKLTLDFEVPDEITKMLVDGGIKEENVEQYLQAILNNSFQQFLNSLPEMLLAMKSGIITSQEIMEKAFIAGSNAADKERPKYTKEKEDADKKS